MQETITREMPIAQIVDKHPETVPVFLAHGLMCFGCRSAQSESLEEGAASHGIGIDALLEDLNDAVNEQTGSKKRARGG
jgi:hybrid cluster-associated redox disulfide protein